MAQVISNLPVGALVKEVDTTYNGESIVFKIMEHNHEGDPDNSTALITNGVIAMRCFDAIEPNNEDTTRQSYGNNRYSVSNIKQWLNSGEEEWYSAQHDADTPPSEDYLYNGINAYDTEKGFLTNFSERFKNMLLETTKKTACNTVCDGGGMDTEQQKIFLLANVEAGGTYATDEGSAYEVFVDATSRIATLTEGAAANNEYYPTNHTAGKQLAWLLRTPALTSSVYVMQVNSAGGFSGTDATAPRAYISANGIRPACCVSSTMAVSDEPDEDGVYSVIWNTAPTITVDNEELGDKNLGFSINYSVSDFDNNTVSIVVKLDETIIQTIESIELGQTYEIEIDNELLRSIKSGEHIITIVADDGEEEVIKSIIFNKVNPGPVILVDDIGLSNKNELFSSATSQLVGGIEFNVLENRKISVNGTATEDVYFNINTEVSFEEGEKILNGCPVGGGMDTYCLRAYNDSEDNYLMDIGNGALFNVKENEVYTVEIVVKSGATVDNLVFAPMIRSADILNEVYEPHIDYLENSIFMSERKTQFDIKYSVSDLNEDGVSIEVLLDSVSLQSIDSATLGNEYIAEITAQTWALLENGTHTITITANDGENDVVRMITFEKVSADITISGVDTILGNVWLVPSVVYSVSDAAQASITVTEYIDNVETKVIENIEQGTDITFDLSTYEKLTDEQLHVLKIKAVNTGGEEEYRYYAFVKLPGGIEFMTKGVKTDAEASYIFAKVDYDDTNSPELTVEVTNCAFNNVVVWEDATAAVKNGEPYTFVNETFDNGNESYGVAVRVSIAKNGTADSVKCYAVGFCFG